MSWEGKLISTDSLFCRLFSLTWNSFVRRPFSSRRRVNFEWRKPRCLLVTQYPRLQLCHLHGAYVVVKPWHWNKWRFITVSGKKEKLTTFDFLTPSNEMMEQSHFEKFELREKIEYTLFWITIRIFLGKPAIKSHTNFDLLNNNYSVIYSQYFK